MEESYWKTAARRAVRRRRLLAGGGVALTAGALLACSSRATRSSGAASGASQSATQASAGTPQPGGSYNAYVTFNAPLDPQKSSNSAQQSISPVMSRLFMFRTGLDPTETTNNDLDNDVAISAESPDAITWTVKLRPDARFTSIAPVNGHAVEPEDIKATFTRALDPATANPNRGSLSMIDPAQIQTPDKQTTVFKLLYPYAPFPKLLASPSYSWIYPREVLTGAYDPATKAIGSGPFTLDSYQPDVAYVYKRNPDWHLKPMPYVDQIRVAIIPDTARQLAQFAAGNVEELVPATIDVPTVRQQNPRAQPLQTKSAAPTPIYLSLADPNGPFADIRVRQALSMVIDRDALNKTLFDGNGVAMAFVPAYLGKWALAIADLPKETQQWYQYNSTQAKQLLSAAGYPNLAVRFGYVTNGPFSSAAYQKLAETVSGMRNRAPRTPSD